MSERIKAKTIDMRSVIYLVNPALFWRKVDKHPADGCWVWVGRVCHRGYGRCDARVPREEGTPRNATLMAHRVALSFDGVDMPHGMVVDHICRNRRCVRPSHLRVVTQYENVMAEGSLAIAKAHALATKCKCGSIYSWQNSSASRTGRRRYCKRCSGESWRKCRERRKQGGGYGPK